jgi:hypothetical protein
MGIKLNYKVTAEKTARGACKRTIRSVLNAKITEWLKTIEDKEVAKLAFRDVFVTGGSIASLLSGEEINDFDLYFKTQETALAVAKYYADNYLESHEDKVLVETYEFTGITGVKEERVRLLKDKNPMIVLDNHGEYEPRCFTPTAISLKDIQLVFRFYGTPEEVHRTYDFVHCTNVYEYAEDRLTLNADAMYSILSKTLIYHGSLYPICSILRTRKFIARGWTINAPQMIKMIIQTQNVNLKDRDTLFDQLVSVDALYFQEFFSRISNNEDIDLTTIAEFMEEAFDTIGQLTANTDDE